jgi:biopolymer transport protein ExbB
MDCLLLLAQAEAEGGDVNYFEVLFTGGGAIGFLLWGISVVVIALSINYLMRIRRINILPDDIRAQVEEMFANRQYREVIDMTSEREDFLSYALNAGLSEAPHGYASMERAMEEAAEEKTSNMLRSIEWLNLIGNISPMLGLLGTVWGMIGAFFSLEGMETVNPQQLAPDIGIALVTTLLGLGVAIPALSVYAFLRNRIDAQTSEAVMVTQELISTFRPSARKSSGSSSSSSSEKKQSPPPPPASS